MVQLSKNRKFKARTNYQCSKFISCKTLPTILYHMTEDYSSDDWNELTADQGWRRELPVDRVAHCHLQSPAVSPGHLLNQCMADLQMSPTPIMQHQMTCTTKNHINFNQISPQSTVLSQLLLILSTSPVYATFSWDTSSSADRTRNL